MTCINTPAETIGEKLRHLTSTFFSLIYLCLFPLRIMQNTHPDCYRRHACPRNQPLKNPSFQWPSLIKISVGNSASRRLFARNPKSGIIFCSAPTRPSVMTWARPFSVAATSRSKGFLEGFRAPAQSGMERTWSTLTEVERESEKDLKIEELIQRRASQRNCQESPCCALPLRWTLQSNTKSSQSCR